MTDKEVKPDLGYSELLIQCTLSPDVYPFLQLQTTFEWLWVLSWIGASIPFYMMCCCTAKPSPSEIALTSMPTAPTKQQIQAEYEYESLLSAKI
jgi:hypothetical protein